MLLRYGLVLLAVMALPWDAAAQYYQDYPPPGYYPPPRPAFGGRCRARADTPNGPERLICAIRRPRPLGEPCDCPPPVPPPGYAAGPPLGGRVIY